VPSLDTSDRSPESLLSKLYSTADPPISLFREQANLIRCSKGLPTFRCLDVTPWQPIDMLCRIVTQPCPAQIHSIFLVPHLSHFLIFETASEASVDAVILKIPELAANQRRPTRLTPDRLLSDFCNYTRLSAVRLGSLVKVVGTEFDGDIGQVVCVFRDKGKVLLKLRPRIDYDELIASALPSQARLNTYKEETYRAPQSFFAEGPLSKLGAPIGAVTLEVGEGRELPAREWDGKKFYGRFQYKKVKVDAILTSVFPIPSDVAALFQAEIYGAEKRFPWLADAVERSLEPALRHKKRPPVLPLSELSLIDDPLPNPAFVPEPLALPPDDEPPKAKSAPGALDSSPFLPGDHVIPISGKFAGVPCRVDRVGDRVVASVLQETLFEVDRARLSVVERPRARPPLADTGVQSADPNNSVESIPRMSRPDAFARASERPNRQTQTPWQLPTVPRPGDLVELRTGNLAMVMRGGVCRDVLGRDFPMASVSNSDRIEEDPTIRDSAGNRVSIGETVRVIKGKNAGREGEVLHMIDRTYFITSRDDVIAVAAKHTLLIADPELQCDIINEEVVTIKKGAISAPYRIVAMATNGTVVAVNSHETVTVKLSEYGSTWKFAAEVGLSRGTKIQKHPGRP
jgi:ribosomal protein L24